MDLNLKNKRIVVTGASRGIGLSIAESFLKEGARVALFARTESTLNDIRKFFLGKYSENNFLVMACDVTDPKALKENISKLKDTWFGIDILVANVGNGSSVPEPMPNTEAFEIVFNTNFKSAEFVVRELIPDLIESEGNIIFISSIAGLEAFGAPTDYSVAKAAIIALSKNLARKLAPKIRVNCIAPGNVYFPGGSWDDKIQKDPERIQNLIESTVPMKRFGSPEEIADLVLFLASERASFITGSCIVVDGGQTVGFH
ncbi:SDR family NAD(P)-dependent oxidoreductase [Leptospira jelokensis]|uniref:SDR family oxidoreductase n=1 Tax=Leptospira jelokensis TaxID=2484931 RepID=A0A4Z1A931_9LEPT|nr:SDR family NAD(P)-dependent oxidoreductase [Leptospira jelokensis]TGL77312.1 SDR family oxidoreductase [Leptospira jelokensis]